MKIEAVVFDIGNVLLKFDYFVAAHQLMAKNGLAELPERGLVVAAKEALEGGKIDRAEFLRQVRPHFGDHSGSDAEFLAIWENIFEENAPMTAIAARLGSRMPTYLLSNISCIHHDFIFRTYPVFGTFHGGVFSYKAGALKPSEAIYRTAIKELEIDPRKTLFIDDLSENIAAAEQLGFHGICYDYREHERAAAAMREFELPV